MNTLFDLDQPTPPNPRTSTPRWLALYETKTGAPARLASGRAIPHHCTCGRLTLTGYDDHICAFQATVDPYAATPQLEAAALILGIPTYQLWNSPPRYELSRRTPFPAAPQELTLASQCVVVLAHDCNRRPLATQPLPVSKGHAADLSDYPPF